MSGARPSDVALQLPEAAKLKVPDGISLESGISEEDAFAIALWNNAALQADLAALGLARADLVDAGLLRNPTLQMLLPVGYRQFEMVLNFPVEVFWQRPRRVEAAKIEVDRVAQGLEQHGLDLVRDVRLAFANLELAKEKARLFEEAVAIRRQIGEITTARLRAGDIAELEANSVRVDLSLAEEQARRGAREIPLSLNRLRFLMGIEGEEFQFDIKERSKPAGDPIANPVSSQQSMETWLDDAFTHRPDVRGAMLAIEAAAKRARWERSRLFAFAGLLSIKQGAGLDFSPRPGFLAELPVFNRNQGGITRADAEVERAGMQYLVVRHQIALEVRESYTRYQQASESLEAYRRRILPQMQEGVRLAQKDYEAGNASYLSVLEATRRWLDARLREVELVNELQNAAVQFDRSLGRKHDAKRRS